VFTADVRDGCGVNVLFGGRLAAGELVGAGVKVPPGVAVGSTVVAVACKTAVRVGARLG
jgi:hypothetical protein